jgi:hypothetical protein
MRYVFDRVWDKDFISGDDALGVVLIDLNPLLLRFGIVDAPSTQVGGGASTAVSGAGSGVATPTDHMSIADDSEDKDNGATTTAGTGSMTDTSIRQISGWFPIYDTLAGCRGMLRLSVKMEFFGDANPFKTSAVGVLTYAGSSMDGYVIKEIHGFVEELVVVDDPEYHWKDSFRAARTSNEARQFLFKKLTNEGRRAVGKKALAVIYNKYICLV